MRPGWVLAAILQQVSSSMPQKQDTPLRAALWLWERKLYPIPVCPHNCSKELVKWHWKPEKPRHPISKKTGELVSMGKVPMREYGYLRDNPPKKFEVSRWFNKWPFANVAVMTGKVSKIVVLDFDDEDAWEALCELTGEEIHCPKLRTGRDGWGMHAWFNYPSEVKVMSSRYGVDQLDPRLSKMDVRSETKKKPTPGSEEEKFTPGIAVVPPSIHASGRPYEWIVSLDEYFKDHDKLPELPDWFLDAAKQGAVKQGAVKQGKKISKKKPKQDQSDEEFDTEDWDSVKELLEDGQIAVYEMAAKHPKVVDTRDNRDPDDRSGSDYAYLRELIKEGILDTDLLEYALESIDSKYQDTGDTNYKVGTAANVVEKHYNFYDAIWLDEARELLGQEFESIDLTKNEKILVCAPIASGKTTQACKLVAKAMEQGISSLILVPLHSLGDEWEEKLGNNGIPKEQIVHLYSATHKKVECQYPTQAKQWLEIGHGNLFRRRYCNQNQCPKYSDCLYITSQAQARSATVLIAAYQRGLVDPGFLDSEIYDNEQKKLVIYDERAEFTKETPMPIEELQKNLEVFEQVKDNEVDFLDLINLVKRLMKWLKLDTTNIYRDRRTRNILLSILYPNRVGPSPTGKPLSDPIAFLSDKTLMEMNKRIANYYGNDRKLERNLLRELAYVLEHGMGTVGRVKDEKKIRLRRSPVMHGERTYLFLSATTSREYLSAQLGVEIDRTIGDGLYVLHDNLKIVQLPNVKGDKTSLLSNKQRQEDVKKAVDYILTKHKGKRVAFICVLGTRDNAKERIIKFLTDTVSKHDRQLVDVTAYKIQTGELPDGVEQIPVVHYGVTGVNNLGQYDVVVELGAYYYGDDPVKYTGIRANVSKKFGKWVPPELTSEKPDYPFKTLAQGSEPVTAKRDVYKVPEDDEDGKLAELCNLLNMEVEQQRADMQQTEGRFIRNDDFHKTIYRLHNVNMEPYPTRIYLDNHWVNFYKGEFGPWVNPDPGPEDKLKRKELEVYQFIQEKIGDTEFTLDDLKDLGMDRSNLMKRVESLVGHGYLSKTSTGKGRGGKNQYQLVK